MGVIIFNMEQYFEILEGFYGNQNKIAKQLGITPVHYGRVRNGRHKDSPSLRRLIVIMADKIESCSSELEDLNGTRPGQK